VIRISGNTLLSFKNKNFCVKLNRQSFLFINKWINRPINIYIYKYATVELQERTKC